MNNYKVSVVTPFHEVNPDYFENCFKSVKAQSIGFENIEWIIVVHNSSEELLRQVQKMASPYDNVIVEALNNDIHSPSSPRNRGLELASAPFVGFLDADDSYKEICLEKAVKNLEETGSQIVVLRRSYELEDENATPVTELTLFDQTQKRIVINMNERTLEDEIKMFTGLCGMVTSRVYDRTFLKENGIWFDEEVPFAEDYLFNINAYSKASKVVYLPQTIGYHYYINKSSLLQSSRKDGKILISYAKGYKKVFDAGIKAGIYMNSIISRLLRVISMFLVYSKDISIEERREIKTILEPYVLQTSMLPVNKVHSERDVHELYNISRDVILSEDNWKKTGTRLLLNSYKDVYGAQRKLLLDILNTNDRTELGQRYRFYSIYSIEDFQERIELSSQSDYADYIDLMTSIGEKNIFSADTISGYSYEIGSSYNKILYPFTEKHLANYMDLLHKIFYGESTFLLFDFDFRSEHFNDGAESYSLSGMLLNNREIFFSEKNFEAGSFDFLVPRELLSVKAFWSSLYLRTLFAIINENTTQIFAPNIYYFLEILRSRHFRECMEDVIEENIRYKGSLTENEYNFMRFNFKVSEERKQTLRRALNCASCEEMLLTIWPKLKKITAFGEGEYKLYRNLASDMFKKIELCNGAFLKSVVPFGNFADDSDEFTLNLTGAFYEFAETGCERKRPLLYKELSPGKTYVPIITNYAGLLRYVTDIKIEFLRYNEDEIPVFRLNNDACSTRLDENNHLSVSDVEDCCREFARRSGINPRLFAVSVTGIRPTVFVERESESKLNEKEMDKYRAIADEVLKGSELIFLQSESAVLYSEFKAARLGISEDMLCPPIIITNPADDGFFRECEEKDVI